MFVGLLLTSLLSTASLALADGQAPLQSSAATPASSGAASQSGSATASASGAFDTSAKHFDCGTKIQHASPHFLDTIQKLHNGTGVGKSRVKVNGGGSPAGHAALAVRQAPIAVDTYFHIVSTNANNGKVTQDMPQKQVDALNSAYQASGVSFNLKGTDWTVNDVWAVGATDADDQAMKSALRKGTYNALNIYFMSDLAGGVLGKCSLPDDVGPVPVDPSTYTTDGCNVQAQTMPGGATLGYSEGMTAVHETGHWLGLLHVFEGYSCDSDGDYIADTPIQSTSTDGCPTSPAKDSCPSQPGMDAIHNVMDYSTDACYTGFSANQNSRISDMWTQYRVGK